MCSPCPRARNRLWTWSGWGVRTPCGVIGGCLCSSEPPLSWARRGDVAKGVSVSHWWSRPSMPIPLGCTLVAMALSSQAMSSHGRRCPLRVVGARTFPRRFPGGSTSSSSLSTRVGGPGMGQHQSQIRMAGEEQCCEVFLCVLREPRRSQAEVPGLCRRRRSFKIQAPGHCLCPPGECQRGTVGVILFDAPLNRQISPAMS